MKQIIYALEPADWQRYHKITVHQWKSNTKKKQEI